MFTHNASELTHNFSKHGDRYQSTNGNIIDIRYFVVNLTCKISHFFSSLGSVHTLLPSKPYAQVIQRKVMGV